MSSETDHPRQRTVAELLAAHGGATPATGRRRRRREADDTGGSAPVAAGRADAASETTALAPPPAPVDRGVLRQPVPRTAPLRPPAAPRRAAAPPPAAPPPRSGSSARPVRENPTDVLPKVRGPQPVDGLTGPMPGRGRPGGNGNDDGPSTMVGMAPVGAEDWHAARTAALRGGTAIDGGPPLPVAPHVAGAGPAGLGGPADLREHDDGYGYGDRDPDDDYGGRGPGRRGSADRDLVDDEDDLDRPPPRERRLGRSVREAPPTTWTTWWLQVLSGALAGAVVWVGFRFLWRSLPVVAVAAAVVVVVGLVLVVRTLLHSEDRRTTVFAVLVGLLLTASPAVLVLLGR